MTLKTCLEIGEDCGLETLGESIFNVDFHAMMIFEYDKINQELTQLYDEADDLYSSTNFTKDSFTKEVLDWINMKNNEVDEPNLNL
jgi:hypothetical protein